MWNGQWQGCANVKMLIVAPFAASTTTQRYDQANLRFIQREKQNYRRICLIYYSSNMDINFMTCVQIEVSSNSKDANQSSIMVSVPLPAKLIPTLLARTSSYMITTKSDPKIIFSRHDKNCREKNPEQQEKQSLTTNLWLFFGTFLPSNRPGQRE